MNGASRGAKTSIDILRERDALEARIRDLEDALALIGRETEAASLRPNLSFVTLCRIGAIARAVTEDEPTIPESTERKRA